MLGEHAFDCNHVGGVFGEPLFEPGLHLEQPMSHIQARAGAHDTDRDEDGRSPHSAINHADTATGEARVYTQNALSLEHQFGL